MRASKLILILVMGILFLQGCAVEEYNSTNSPKMVVTADHTPFYRKGPAQGGGPDFSLTKGETVEVLRKELGYSFVRLLEGDNGYVANEALTPVATPSPSATPSASPGTSKKGAASGSSTNAPSNLGFRY